jgi:hypothetical protein
MLRYGDGTPFPFGEELLELLEDAVATCTQMLAATASLDRQRAEAEAALVRIGEEERRLVMFERAVAAVCTPPPSAAQSVAAAAAEQTRSAMATAVDQSRDRLRRLSAAQGSAPGWARTARRVQAAAARFFERHVLPGTGWTWLWDVTTGVARAETTGYGARFRVCFDVDLPPPWDAAIPIATLAPGTVAQLPQPRWLRRPVDAPIALDEHAVVRAVYDVDRRELVIRERGARAGGWHIELPHHSMGTVTLLDRRDRPRASSFVEPTELASLLRAIDAAMLAPGLARHAREVILGGRPVSELADTTLAPRALLDELGPVVREIRARSRMPGELTLKRDIADGKREELYVSRAALTARYASLPPRYRMLLDAAGFGDMPPTTRGELTVSATAARGSTPPLSFASAPGTAAPPRGPGAEAAPGAIAVAIASAGRSAASGMPATPRPLPAATPSPPLSGPQRTEDSVAITGIRAPMPQALRPAPSSAGAGRARSAGGARRRPRANTERVLPPPPSRASQTAIPVAIPSDAPGAAVSSRGEARPAPRQSRSTIPSILAPRGGREASAPDELDGDAATPPLERRAAVARPETPPR